MTQKLIKTAIIGLGILTLLLLGLTGYLIIIIYPDELTVPPIPTATVTILKWEGDGDGLVTFNISGYNAVRFGSGHYGDRNFIVHLLDAHGNLIGGAASCIGNCEDDNIVQVYSDGQYYLEVTADGPWFIVAMPLE